MGKDKKSSDKIKKRKRDADVDDQGRRKKSKSRSHVPKPTPTPTSSSELQLLPNGVGENEAVLSDYGNGIPPRSDDTTANRLSTTAAPGCPNWQIATPMGGRMLNLDPIFSPDEQYLIIPYNTSIQVYSVADSLLVRRIPLPVQLNSKSAEQAAIIVALALSRASPDFIWVAFSDGRLWRINWTNGQGQDAPFTTVNGRIFDLTVDQLQSVGQDPTDVVLMTQQASKGTQLVAYDANALLSGSGKVIYAQKRVMTNLKCIGGSSLVIMSTEETVHVGFAKEKSRGAKFVADLGYHFFKLDVGDIVSCLDIQARSGHGNHHHRHDSYHLAIGCARGAILVYSGVEALLGQVDRGQAANQGAYSPRKYHWHRKAVHSVKWSRDEGYLVSGGSEQVLILWQLETSKRETLPHLSASLENIVVSPRGASYAIHLDDNSTMILATSNMLPITYVSGIQALVLGEEKPKDFLVKRVSKCIQEISLPPPAVLNPVDSSQLLLCVGNGQQAAAAGDELSLPFVQIFDLTSFQSLAKQAVARNHSTNVNITPSGHPVTEPCVTKMVLSGSGKWMATVDEWQPPSRDVEVFTTVSQNARAACEQRSEVLLKFWQVDSENKSLHLTSRVNEAHQTHDRNAIFDIAADKVSSRFATLGGDGCVRFWYPKPRPSDSLTTATKDTDAASLHSWACSRAVSLNELSEVWESHSRPRSHKAPRRRSGALAFSDDGSVLVAALGLPSDVTFYVIDSKSGEVRSQVRDLCKGPIRRIQILLSCAIILSDILVVYDLVTDEARYVYDIGAVPSSSAALRLLAVDPLSRTFAVSIPRQNTVDHGESSKRLESDVGVFSLGVAVPVMVQCFPCLITALLPMIRSPGYLALDTSAQIWSIIQSTDSVSISRPLADIHLDAQADATHTTDEQLAITADRADEMDDDDEMQVDPDEDVDMVDEDIHAAVIAPQKLTELFDTGPSFAMSNIEDLFYQVARLLNRGPGIATSV